MKRDPPLEIVDDCTRLQEHLLWSVVRICCAFYCYNIIMLIHALSSPRDVWNLWQHCIQKHSVSSQKVPCSARVKRATVPPLKLLNAVSLTRCWKYGKSISIKWARGRDLRKFRMRLSSEGLGAAWVLRLRTQASDPIVPCSGNCIKEKLHCKVTRANVYIII